MKFSLIGHVALIFLFVSIQNVSSEGIEEILNNSTVHGNYQSDNFSGGTSKNSSQANSHVNESNQPENKIRNDNIYISMKKQMTMEEVIYGFYKADCSCRILYTLEGIKLFKTTNFFMNGAMSIEQYCSLGDLSLLQVSIVFSLVLDSYHIEIVNKDIQTFNDGYKKIVPVVFIPNDKSEDPNYVTLVMRNTEQLGWVIDLDASGK